MVGEGPAGEVVQAGAGAGADAAGDGEMEGIIGIASKLRRLSASTHDAVGYIYMIN